MKEKMTSFLDEFKAFAFKGNMLDLAVAVVIGGAFGKVIDALVKDIIMPLISYVFAFIPGSDRYATWMVGRFPVGHLLAEVINFVVIAAAVFIVIVKLLGALMKKASPPPPAGEPTTKECPRCLSMIPIKATKCGHCTIDLAAG